MKALPRPKPCPFCGEPLVEKDDQDGKWYGHRNEAGDCWASPARIRDDADAKRWNARPEKALPAPKGLTPKQLAFVDAYMEHGNATRAYGSAYSNAKASSCATEGGKFLRNPEIATELAHRRADLAERNGIKLDQIIQRLKNMAFTNITAVLGSPSTWPEGAEAAVKHYRAAGPQSGVKITLYDRPMILLELWDRLFPGQGATSQVATNVTNNVLVQADKVMMALRSPLLPTE